MITTPANDKIIWEKTRTWNIGFDTDLWNSRLSVSLITTTKRQPILSGR